MEYLKKGPFSVMPGEAKRDPATCDADWWDTWGRCVLCGTKHDGREMTRAQRINTVTSGRFIEKIRRA